MILQRSIILAIILTAVSLPSVPGQNCDWTGTWKTSWGDVFLTQSGNTVTGTYVHDQGKITGSIFGDVLSGTWSEYPTYSAPNDAGDFEFTMTACDTFQGRWRYGSSGDWRNDWSGSRVSVPRGFRECETSGTETICGTWVVQGNTINARWENGAAAVLTIERWDSDGVVITRYDPEGASAGLSAHYEGKLDAYNNIVDGRVTWDWKGSSWSGTWDAEPATVV